MKRLPRLSLGEWAAIGEVVASLAVVASLLFLVYSVNQNTHALHGSNENIIFERHADLMNMVISDPSMAEILVKRRADEPLSDIEAVRWEKFQLNLVDIWALAHSRYQADLLSESHWTAWDRYFSSELARTTSEISEQSWQEMVDGFDREFWEHVNRSLFGAD